MNYKLLFESTVDNYVPTITFNFKGDGRDSLGFRKIDELTDDFVVLSDSISTFRLYFDYVKTGEIEVNDVKFTVVYYGEFPNHRFIIVNRQDDRKHLVDLLDEDKSDELFMIDLFE